MGALPVRLREGSTAHRAYVRGAWAATALVLALPVVAAETGSSFASLDQATRVIQLNTVAAFAVAILGLDLVVGYTGQLALGQSAFVGLGAYTTVILVADHHWSFYAAIPATAAISFLAGLLVGIPATRVKGLYLAIVTLVLAAVFPSLVLRFEWLTGGANGKGPPRTQGKLRPPSWLPFADTGRLAGPLWVYCLSIGIAAGTFVVARNVVHSRTGRAVVTMRDHEPAATALGVDVPTFKALAFGASAACGGLAGAMLMMNRPFATDSAFTYRMSIFLLAALVIGGVGTLSGAIPGALAYVFVPFFLTEWAFDQRGLPFGIRQLSRPLFALLRPAGGEAGAMFFGAALIVLMFVFPGGLVAGARRARDRLVTIEPRPTWLATRRAVVPFVAAHHDPPAPPVAAEPDDALFRRPGSSPVVGTEGAQPIVVIVAGAGTDADPDAPWRRPSPTACDASPHDGRA